ncbi:MAG: aminotransferase class IV [Bacteroidota bacterium]|nr:aminotransferase class IV [Bacteroidota bacterium]
MITGKVLGNKYVRNNISADASGFVPDMSADIYYEVVRLIDGKILFLPDHLDRLQQSISGSGIIYPGKLQIMENLSLLVRENPFREGNIRISLQKSNGGEAVLQCYFIPYVYPDPIMYKQGVKLAIYPHVRPNPGVKKWDDQFRNSVSRYILEQKVYEAALINSQNQITEGSRSNIFFIDQQACLVTVPEKVILPGITRKYVLEIAHGNGIPVIEKNIPLDSLGSLPSAFISGTSPKVLPVNKLDNYCFDVNHPLLNLLMSRFEQLIQENLTDLNRKGEN